MAGETNFNVIINGTNFTNDSIAYWNGEPRPTTFVSSTQLMVAISAADIATPGNVDVIAFAPSPGGGGATMSVTVIGQSTTVSAASYSGGTLSSESIVSAFGLALATIIESAATIPLPTSLAGTTVKVKDSAGGERLAPLFYVSPTQVNYLIPAGTTNGAALVIISNGDGVISTGIVQIETVSPGLFSANSTGKGLATGYIQRVKVDKSQVVEPIVVYDPAQQKLIPVPIDVSNPAEEVYLAIYGTGIRFNSGLSGVVVKVGGKEAQVLYAKEQGYYIGLDQINLRLARELAGKGEVDLEIIVDGKPANTVKVYIK